MNQRDSVTELRFTGAQALDKAVTDSLSAIDALALGPGDRNRLAIIVEELLANLFDHGGGGADSAVVLRLSPQPDHILLVLEDGGVSFDPASADPVSSVPERGGGAGLALVRAWAEQLSYTSGPLVNRLELRYSLVDRCRD